jgi:hypothetical protein
MRTIVTVLYVLGGVLPGTAIAWVTVRSLAHQAIRPPEVEGPALKADGGEPRVTTDDFVLPAPSGSCKARRSRNSGLVSRLRLSTNFAAG